MPADRELYGDRFYQAIREGSDRSASVIVPLAIDLVKPASVVDVGCGTGAWLAQFREHGVNDILGLEFSEVSGDLADLDRSHIRIVDASKPFQVERQFDLVVSVEVAEHLPGESAAGFIRSLTALGPVVLFSAAVPGQTGTNHINEQWPSYWVRHFAESGFQVLDCLRDRIWRDDRIEWWYRQNLLLFVRQDLVSQYSGLDVSAAALDRMMPYALRKPVTKPTAPERTGTLGVIILSRNGAGYLANCLRSIVERDLADEIAVFVDRETTDATAEIARQFTPHVHSIQTQGTIESVLPEMASRCSAEYLLRVDDDETLGGDWDRGELDALVRFNDLTHLVLPRRWLISPGDVFIANEPWFPDFQVRFFRNDHSLIRWASILHDPMVIRGRGMTLFDRWIEHHDLIVKSRPQRERKAEYYQRLRPEKHLSNFYLYEEREIQLLPADDAGFAAAAATYIAGYEGRTRKPPGSPYHPGADIRFEAGGNGAEYTQQGWWDPEPWGTWTKGYRAELRIPVERPLDGPALLTVEAGAYLNAKHPTLRVEVACGREIIGGWSVEAAEPVERSLSIPAPAIAGRKELLLAFHLENPTSPAESGESDDQRLLGLGFRKLKVEPEAYQYQPDHRLGDFESALTALRNSVPNRVVESAITGGEADVLPGVLDGLKRLGVKVESFTVSESEHAQYRERAQYDPTYYPDHIAEKSLEHYLTLSLLQPGPSDVLIDIAAEHSPLHEIASRLTGCRAYAQDIMYPPAIQGNRMGGDACAMPVADGFASGASLTCSFEHFEGDADIRLFRELARVLRPGGNVVVVPLYLWTEPMAVTDPTVSVPAGVRFDDGAAVYAIRGWNNRHGRFYAPETLASRILSCPGFQFTVLKLSGVERMSGVYARWVLVGQRK